MEREREKERKKKKKPKRNRDENGKMAPLLCFRFPSCTGTPSNSKRASRQAGKRY